MSDLEYPDVPAIDAAYRTAYHALADIALSRQDPAENLATSEVVDEFDHIARQAKLRAALELGPLVSWEGPRPLNDELTLVMAIADLDTAEHQLNDIALSQGAFEGPDGQWQGGSLHLAAHAYKRQAGWDFTPGEAGIWLLMLAPIRCSGAPSSADPWWYRGHITSFAILYDRDEDGTYESVGHVWTASAWQRRGIARRLLGEARSRFQFTAFEQPFTSDGTAFLTASGYLSPGGAGS
jgi:GNAT superfamily N-acetyltransferase